MLRDEMQRFMGVQQINFSRLSRGINARSKGTVL